MMFNDCLKKLEEEMTDVPYEKEQYCNKNGTETVIFSDDEDSPSLSEKDARRMLELEVYFSKVKGKKLDKRLKIVKISHSYVHTYSLQTWTQKRQLFWQFKKYKFGRIDDESFGCIQDAWDIPIPDPDKIKPFSNQTEKVIVKHSEHVQACYNCSNLIQVSCAVCGGNKKLIYYLNCKISWQTYKDEYVTEPNYIPINKLKLASSESVFEEEEKKVNPINYVEDEDISKASEKYHKQHIKNSRKERILLQKQNIKKIKVFTVHYSWKGQIKRIFIYGDEKNREVHVPYSLNQTPSTLSNLLTCIFL